MSAQKKEVALVGGARCQSSTRAHAVRRHGRAEGIDAMKASLITLLHTHAFSGITAVIPDQLGPSDGQITLRLQGWKDDS